MYLKRGPKGTFRAYSKMTGKYVPMGQQDLFVTTGKHKKTKQEREKFRDQVILSKASKSNDVYLYECVRAITKAIPGTILFVNDKFHDKSIGSTRELDIVTKTSVIEVKSGQVKKKMHQFLGQKAFAERGNKRHIVFAPEIPGAAREAYTKAGIKIVKTLDELIRGIKK